MATIISFVNKVLMAGYHRMTLDYGNTYSDGSFHKGIDLTGNLAVLDGYDDVCAVADGKVISMKNTFSGTTKDTGKDGMGNFVIIEHKDGIRTRYQHLGKGTVTVKTGQYVKKGQKIGRLGNTGNSSGRHLHFDISYDRYMPQSYKSMYDGQYRYYVDPKPFLQGKKAIGFEAGTYTVIKAVNVREKPTAASRKITYSEFTANAKKQVAALDKTCPSEFPKGVRVTLSEFEGNWGKCPSGWINMNFVDYEEAD